VIAANAEGTFTDHTVTFDMTPGQVTSPIMQYLGYLRRNPDAAPDLNFTALTSGSRNSTNSTATMSPPKWLKRLLIRINTDDASVNEH